MKPCPFVFLALVFFASAASAADPQYTADGQMRFPTDYREWIFLSSGLGMTYAQPAQGEPNFDNVFASPEAYKAFVKTGSWPEKTVLVLEVRRSDSHVSINTGGHVQAAVTGVEVHVKDSSRFKGGWGFFAFGKSDTAKLIPATAGCYGCHELHGAVETTFVQFYPTLIDIAKQKGTFK
jgi:hypothetical protein